MRQYVKALMVASAALLLLVLVPAYVHAAVVTADEGSSTRVEAGRSIDDDLYIAGDPVLIEGTVNGDVYAAGSSVTIKGTVNGTVFAAAQDILISGTITGGVRVAGQTVRITSPSIGGGVSILAQTFTIDPATTINGGLNFAASSAVISGKVGKSIAGSAEKTRVEGTLGQNANIASDNLVLGRDAAINGDLTYYGSANITREQGAVIKGQTHHHRPSRESQREEFASAVTSAIWGLLAAYIVGALLIMLAPRLPLGVAAELTERPLLSLGWGLLMVLLVPLVAILLLLSFIALPLALILITLFVLGLYLAHFWVGLAIGEWIAGRADWKPNPYANAFAGLLCLTLIELVPVIGGSIKLFVVILGLGGLVQYARHNLPINRKPIEIKDTPKATRKNH
jgi:cytoskeletal protein CcmA (bactofilin family)